MIKEVYEYTIFGSRHLVMKTIDVDGYGKESFYGVDIFDEAHDNVVNLRATNLLSEARKTYNYWKRKFAQFTQPKIGDVM